MPNDTRPRPVPARPKHRPLQALQAGLSPQGPSCWRPGPQREPRASGSTTHLQNPSCTLTSSPRPPSLGRPGGGGGVPHSRSAS